MVPSPPADPSGADTEPEAEDAVGGCKISKNDSELRQNEIVKTVIQFKNRQIF